ncbi:hypothetical protein AB1K62_14340 [Parasphingorhabdus sp. JC815]|uniref:hypothetical protein n=1 Tax=Parasphingorhabdus sp. JC815 TaxID=3232140 RepID=UPI003457DF9F
MAKPKGQKENRSQLYGERLPELAPTERLADIWRQIGYARDGMAGVVPFDWTELAAFSKLTECDLAPVEAECLMDMSRGYANMIVDTNPLSIAPMDRADD